MKAVIVLAAYLLTGAFYVWRQLRQTNYVRAPLYVMQYRATGDVSRLLLVGFGWLLSATINREFFYWLIFAVLAAIGIYLSDI
jgi:hypothetical protein